MPINRAIGRSRWAGRQIELFLVVACFVGVHVVLGGFGALEVELDPFGRIELLDVTFDGLDLD